ncbi:MAG: dephospho-CoA kinase [Candidatus Sumerlaeia bacterium]|nr:dephospho-CoA kinase [Candidatus Sumerlaeia bacterium]
MILGLTGSIGSGKTFVTRCFEELGASVIRADELAREVVAPGTPAYSEIVEFFGPAVVTADGTLDRAEIARRVFANPGQRRELERIVHPRVRQREEELLQHFRHEPLVVLEIPLLYETGAEALCDAVLVVVVEEEVRRQRLQRDRGMSPQDIAARLAAQMPEHEKVRRAQYVIDNSGSRERTRDTVRELHARLLAEPQA